MGDKIEDGPRAEHIHDNDLDEKIDLETRDHLLHLTEAELEVEKKLKKKIDRRIMPIIILIYLMNYIDRSASSPFHFPSSV